jgi:GNAT superfamily N-acetyltransferase
VPRNAISLRDANPADAEVLVAMWRANDHGRSAPDLDPSVESAARAIGHVALDPEQRLVLAEIDGEVVGVAFLVRAPLSPIHEETVVRVGHMFVTEDARRHGVGRALLAAATAWADEKQTAHVMVNAPAAAREANRFLARLGLASIATVRAAAVPTLQERLAARDTGAADGPVVVERLRTLRRRQASARATRRRPA